jgi:hypothetical protein
VTYVTVRFSLTSATYITVRFSRIAYGTFGIWNIVIHFELNAEDIIKSADSSSTPVIFVVDNEINLL